MWLEKMWKVTPPEARDEYEEYVNRFYNYNAAQPGDPPSFIAEAMEEAMLAGRPELGYKARLPHLYTFFVQLFLELGNWCTHAYTYTDTT